MKYPSILLILGVLFIFIGCAPEPKQSTGCTDCVIEVQDAWTRPGKADMMSAAYFTVINRTGTPDTLLSARSNVSPDTQIHMSFMNEDGLMAMEEQKYVALPDGDTVIFKQGGLHVMIIRPEKDIAVGDTVKLTLQLSSGRSLKVDAPVKQRN